MKCDLENLNEVIDHLSEVVLTTNDPEERERTAKALGELLKIQNSQEDLKVDKEEKEYQRKKDRRELYVRIGFGAANVIVPVILFILTNKWENGGHISTLSGTKSLNQNIGRKIFEKTKI